jgi:hypothetical protein
MAIAPTIRDTFMAKLGPDYVSAYPKNLEEHYPHVLEKIASAWGTLAMEPLFDSLLVTQRTGRQGFSVDAFAEVTTLVGVYRKLGLATQPPKKDGDVWNWISDIGYSEDGRSDA